MFLEGFKTVTKTTIVAKPNHQTIYNSINQYLGGVIGLRILKKTITF